MAAPDLAARNQAHFDDVASKLRSTHNFDSLIDAIIAEFHARRSWIHPRLETEKKDLAAEEPLTLLDYACGDGTVSKALLPYTTRAIGLDISPGQVAAYNAWTTREGIPPERAHASQLNLLASASSSNNGDLGASKNDADDAAKTVEAEVELKDFDVVAISMALHHVADPAALLRRLAGCLKTGGTCVVLDMLPAEQQDALGRRDMEERLEGMGEEVREMARKAAQVIQTHGFAEGEMEGLLEGAGLGAGMEYVVREEPFEFTVGGVGIKVKCFFAKGTKVDE